MKKIASMFLMLVLVLSCVSANAEYLTVSDAESYAWDKDVDMVVVGFGLAGAATVIEAADIANDAEIVLLERAVLRRQLHCLWSDDAFCLAGRRVPL